MWEKKTDDGGINDKDNGYSWSITGAPYAESGSAFTSFLLTVNVGGFAGANGWRLPTVAEVQTILLDFRCTGEGGGPTCRCPSFPCVDPALDFANTHSGFSTGPFRHPAPSPPTRSRDVRTAG